MGTVVAMGIVAAMDIVAAMGIVVAMDILVTGIVVAMDIPVMEVTTGDTVPIIEALMATHMAAAITIIEGFGLASVTKPEEGSTIMRPLVIDQNSPNSLE
jgi:fructose-specific phosphotransferase system component IIB